MDLLSRLIAAGASGAPLSGGWDITNLSFSGTPVNGYNAYGELRNLRRMTIANSGTKLYIASVGVVGDIDDYISEYTLTTAWDISTAVYVSSLDVSPYESTVTDVAIKSDGTKIYCLGNGGDEVNEFDLSVAWDLSTATHNQVFSVAAQDATPQAFAFKPDGTKMYVTGSTNDNVYEYSLSTAWDISSASYVQAFSFSSQAAINTHISFKPDGTKMFLGYSDDIWEYNLSTAWDVSTASYSTSKLNFTQPISFGAYVFFKDDGTRLYWADATKTCFFQTELLTAWSVTSIQTQQRPSTYYYSVSSSGLSSPQGLDFKSDGTKMYLVDSVARTVYEYDLSTAWDITSSSLNQTFSVGALLDTSYGLYFKPDGTKFYFVGLSTDNVHQYDLSTAWDISTATYTQGLYIGAEQPNPRYLTFKPDGTKMYVSGASGDELDEYDLSTAWDISTAVANQSAANYYLEASLNFKTDGTKLITVLYTSSGRSYLNEYSLSTPWDISTLSSPLTTQDLMVQNSAGGDSYITEDGKRLYVTDSELDAVVAYDL